MAWPGHGPCWSWTQPILTTPPPTKLKKTEKEPTIHAPEEAKPKQAKQGETVVYRKARLYASEGKGGYRVILNPHINKSDRIFSWKARARGTAWAAALAWVDEHRR